MGRFDAEARRGGASRGGSGSSIKPLASFITEPGDPDFTSSAASQGQVPAASAQKKQLENARAAQRVIANAESFGYDTSGPDFEPLHEVAATGLKEEPTSFIAEAVGWIDGPRQAMNLLIQDMVGGEAGAEFRNPNFGDYWNAWWSGIDDEEDFELATGLNPISGSMTIDMFGWEEAEGLGERIGRGVADFSLQMLTDPLTYLTFGLSGLGKKVALAAGRGFQERTILNLIPMLKKPAVNPKLYRSALDEAVETGSDALSVYERKLARDLDDHIVVFTEELAEKGAEVGGRLPPDMERALQNYLGTGAPIGQANFETIAELALANRMFKDIIRPVLNRSFKDVDKLALKELPAFMSGGARISIPFIGGNLTTPGRNLGTLQKGLVIPGTQGLGRKLVGDPIRRLSDNLKKLGFVGTTWDNFSTAVAKGTSKMDQMAPILRGLRDGDIQGWQYHIAASAIDTMNNNAAKHGISTELNAMWNNITGLADEAGQDLSHVGREVMYRLDAGDIDEVLKNQVRDAQRALGPEQAGNVFPGAIATGNKKLDDAMSDMVSYLQETMGEYHDALSILDPEFAEKFIKGYVPHSPTKQARKFITAFAKESSGKSGKGNTAEDVWAYILNAAGQAGSAAPEVGGSGHVGRQVGRAQALQIYNEKLLMLDKDALEVLALQNKVILPMSADGKLITDTLEQTGLSVPALNDLLRPIIERESKRLNITLPNNWDGTLFNENPIEVMLDYLDSMTDAINSWNLMESLRASGLAFTHTTELNVQNVARNIQNNAMRAAATIPSSSFGRPVDGETAMAPIDFLAKIGQPKDRTQALKNVSGSVTGDLDRTALVKSVRAKGVQTPVVIEVWQDGSYRLAEGHNRVAAAELAGNTPEIPVQFVPAGNIPAPKNGTVGEMKMKPGWFDEATETTGGVSAVRGEAFDQGRIGFIEGDPTWEAYQALEIVPWGPATHEQNLLFGGANQGAIPGVPRDVHEDLTKAGFKIRNLEDVADARELANDVASMTPQGWATPAPAGGFGPSPLSGIDDSILATKPGAHDWRVRRTGAETLHVFSEAVGVRGIQGLEKTAKAAIRIVRGGGDREGSIQITIKGGSLREKALQRRAIIEFLGRAFDEGGELEGMFSAKGMRSFIDSGMNEETSELLHEFARQKLGTMSKEAKEFISKEPAEIFDARLLYEETKRGLQEWIGDVTGVRVGGSLISGPESVQLFGTDETVRRLRGLQDAANTLGEKGYDTMAEVMRDVDDFAGVQKIDKMINPADFNLQGPAIGDLQIQTNVAEWLSLTARNMGAIYTPEGVAAAKLAARETLKWWRAMATLPRPAFHIRNLIGGSWMNAAVGVQSKSMGTAARYGVAFRNAIRNGKPGQALEDAFLSLPEGRIRNAWREMMSRNVLAGFATTEFSGALTPKGMAQRWDFLNALDVDNFALTRAGGKIMESVEDFMRASLFLQYYDDAVPGSGRFAAELVNAIHFNYSNLTPMETKMKSIIPFFVWARRNVPLQIQMAVENPRYVQRYRAMMQAMDDNLGGDDPENLQEADHFTAWASGTDYKVNPGTPFWSRLIIDPDLPISDLLELPNLTPANMIEFADGLLGPHIGFLSDVNAQRDLGDVNAPAPFNAVLASLAAFGLYDKTTDGDVRLPYLMRTLLETGIPYSRELADPVSGGPTDPNRQQRLGIKEDDDFITSTLKSIGGQLAGGAGFKFTTPADTRSAGYRTAEEIQKLIKELRLRGELPQADET